MKNNTVLGTLAVLGAVFFWGLSGASIKIALQEVPPVTLVVIRFAIASIILFSISKITNNKVKLKSEDKGRVILCVFLCVTVYYVLENFGLKLISVSNATIVLGIIPLLTVIAEKITTKKPIGKQKSIGAALTVIGIGGVIGKGIGVDANTQEIIGTILMLGAAFSWVIFSVVNKKIEDKYPVTYMSAMQIMYGTLFLIPFTLMESKLWQPISMVALGNIMYLAVCCSAACYIFVLYGLKTLGPVISNAYINLIPLVSIISAYLILGERLYPLQLVGGGITLLGIGVISYIKPSKVVKEPELSLNLEM